MQQSCSYGPVGAGEGNLPLYPDAYSYSYGAVKGMAAGNTPENRNRKAETE